MLIMEIDIKGAVVACCSWLYNESNVTIVQRQDEDACLCLRGTRPLRLLRVAVVVGVINALSNPTHPVQLTPVWLPATGKIAGFLYVIGGLLIRLCYRTVSEVTCYY